MTSAAFVAALKPLLEARPGLAGVAVHLVDTVDVTAPSIVLLWDFVHHDIEWIAMGPKRTDEVRVPGMVRTNGVTVQDAADQALAIIAEIGLQALSPPQVGAQTQKANVDSIDWAPLPNEKGGWVVHARYELVYTSNLA